VESLRKDVPQKLFIILMFLILLAGVLFFFGLHLYTEQISFVSPEVNQSPVTREPVSLELNLSSPEDNQLFFESDTLVQGKTSPGSFVLLSSEEKDTGIETTPEGNFSLTVKLLPGLNRIAITAFDQSGNSKSEERTVYYSKEKI